MHAPTATRRHRGRARGVAPQVDIESNTLDQFILFVLQALKSTRGQPGVNLGSTWGQYGVSLGSTPGQPRVHPGSICTTLPRSYTAGGD